MAKKSSKKAKTNISMNTLLTALAYVVIGILLIWLKGGSINILMTIIGALFILAGIADIFASKQLIDGVVKIAIGIAIIIFGWALVNIALIVLGVLLILKGILDFLKIFKKGILSALPALATILIGILIICAKWVDVLFIVAGIVFVINGILVLFGKRIIKK